MSKTLICSYKSKEETWIHISLMKQQFVLAHTIRPTEIPAVLECWVKSTPYVKILYLQKLCLVIVSKIHNATLLKRIKKNPVEFALVSTGPTQRLHSVGMVFFRRRYNVYSLKIKGEWASVDFKPTKIYPSGTVNFGKRKISSWTAWP
jgi:hypothetical protein